MTKILRSVRDSVQNYRAFTIKVINIFCVAKIFFSLKTFFLFSFEFYPFKISLKMYRKIKVDVISTDLSYVVMHFKG